MRSWLLWIALCVVSLATVPPLMMARGRAAKSGKPRVHLIPDMDTQPKFKAQTTSTMFADGRAMRLPVENTVARGELRDDRRMYLGKRAAEEWTDTFPVPVTEGLMRRGQERYGIFCATCHGLGGFGDGPVARRAEELQEGTWVPPPSFHTDTTRNRPHGELFDIITHGVRTMQPYGSQIPVADRWAIVAYLRALQRSQNASVRDVPPDVREQLEGQ